MKANIEFSKKHPEIGKEFIAFLKSVSWYGLLIDG
jgi:hypothetical protein